jgi:hypothetical protein
MKHSTALFVQFLSSRSRTQSCAITNNCLEKSETEGSPLQQPAVAAKRKLLLKQALLT